MQLRLAYGRDGLLIDVPAERTTVIEPRYSPALPEPPAALRAALRSPLGAAPLRRLARPGQRVAISVCDVTRPAPRRAVLAAIFEELEGVRPQDIVILIATGTHRANTRSELEEMLGPDILARYRVVNHDARERGSLVNLGLTGTGVPVLLNREWAEADLRLTTGVVEPHFFAGFSGGPKMVAPGLAGLDTVLALHDAAHIGHPRATWGITEGNPVHDDVREIARTTGVHFSLDVTLNDRQEITGVFAGELFAAHAAACADARAAAMQPVSGPFEVVITSNSGYPLDQNLYQAVKGMSAAAQVVKPGGVIICAAECQDGLPAHGSYAHILARQPSPQALLAMISTAGYSEPDQWQVQVQAGIQMKARVLLKAGRLSAAQLRAAHLEPVDDVSEAARQALAAAGPGARLCVLPDGPKTIPYLA
ncbi:MAG: nickel-dependent lactate racemase [Dehalococcoidia bacterium]|nr:nickel-dependent lactate racemase [Dehalococcoidia bacterium]